MAPAPGFALAATRRAASAKAARYLCTPLVRHWRIRDHHRSHEIPYRNDPLDRAFVLDQQMSIPVNHHHAQRILDTGPPFHPPNLRAITVPIFAVLASSPALTTRIIKSRSVKSLRRRSANSGSRSHRRPSRHPGHRLGHRRRSRYRDQFLNMLFADYRTNGFPDHVASDANGLGLDPPSAMDTKRRSCAGGSIVPLSRGDVTGLGEGPLLRSPCVRTQVLDTEVSTFCPPSRYAAVVRAASGQPARHPPL